MSESDRYQIIGKILEEFILELRSGNRPDIEAFVAREPKIATQVREALSTVMLLESPDKSDSGESHRALPDLPEQIGEFRILRLIGRGGMGRVFEAVQDSLDRRVALKVMSWNQLGGDEQSTRFLQEAQVAARLHHTNIVPVFQVGNTDDLFYYAMQLIDGSGLDSVIHELQTHGEYVANSDRMTVEQSNPLERQKRQTATTTWIKKDDSLPLISKDRQSSGNQQPEDRETDANNNQAQSEDQTGLVSLQNKQARYFSDIARIVRQAAEALNFAHANNILHRDIKPANLLLDIEGNAWVTDFGLAKFEGTDLTRTGQIVGTLRYMAPERLEGRDDHRCDIYSLGLTLFELATLKPAFPESDQAALIGRLGKDNVSDPIQMRADIPNDLRFIIVKATSREPSLRYQNAGEFAEDLKNFEEGRPVSARKPSAYRKTWLWCKRNPVVAGLLSAVFLLMLLISIGSFLTANNIKQKNQRIARQYENEKRLRAASDQNLLDAAFSEFQALAGSHTPGRSLRRLDCVQTARQIVRNSPDSSDQKIRFRNMVLESLAMLDLEETKRVSLVSKGTNPDDQWGFSNDLKQIARISTRGELQIVDVSNGKLIQQLDVNWFYGRTRFSADNRFLAVYGVRRNLTCWCAVYDCTLKKRILNKKATTDLGIRCAMSFDTKSTRFAFRSEDNTIHVVNLKSNKTVCKTPKLTNIEWLALSPDGTQLVFDQGDQIAQVFVDRPEHVEYFRCPDASTIGCWSPIPGWFATASVTGKISIWSVDNPSAPIVVLRGHSSRLDSLSFHPSGLLLMSSSDDGTTRIWDRNGTQLVTDRGGTQFHHNGMEMAFFDPDVGFGMWKVTGVPVQEFGNATVPDFGNPFTIGVSPDGSTLAWTSDFDTVPLVNLTNNKIRFIDAPETTGDSVVFLKSGNKNYLLIATPKGCIDTELDSNQQPSSIVKKLVEFENRGQRILEIGDGMILATQYGNSIHCFGMSHSPHQIGTDWWCGGVDYSKQEQIVVVTSKGNPKALLFRRSDLLGNNPQPVPIDVNLKSATMPCFGPDGILAFSGIGGITVVKIKSDLSVQAITNIDLPDSEAFTRVDFSDDGKILAATTYDAVNLYETKNWTLVARLQTLSNVKIAGEILEMSIDVKFAGSDRWVVVGTSVGSVLVWDLQAMRKRLEKLGLNW